MAKEGEADDKGRGDNGSADDDADEEEEEDTGGEEGDEEKDGDDEEKDGDKPDSELARWKRRAQRRDRELRRAQAELAAAKKEKEGAEDDPVAKANKRLVTASARTILAGAGVTERADQQEVISLLNLSDISVDDEGPDEDEIEDRIDRLRSIFGAKSSAPGRTLPRTTKTKDKGSKDTADSDSQRYRRILGNK